jgi:hypothetical protein
MPMPIETPEAPKPSIEALRTMLPALVASAGVRQTAPRFAASLLASPQNLASPGLSYPVYALGLADVASGAGVRKAKLSAWRHEFAAEGEVVSAEVSAGRRPQFAGLNVNSRFRSVQQELRLAAETAADFAGKSYEARLLQISAMGVRALWLKAKSRSHADVVIPLAPTRRELTAGRHYSPEEFVAALKGAAEAMLAAEAPGKGA